MLCHVVIQGLKIAHIIDYVQILCLPMPDPGITGKTAKSGKVEYTAVFCRLKSLPDVQR